VAHATVVDGDERVAELSRMLAGVGDSSHARGHAAELLASAAGSLPAGSGARRGRR
jgi:DNA repair protein RecN (Recombination protein N)